MKATLDCLKVWKGGPFLALSGARSRSRAVRHAMLTHFESFEPVNFLWANAKSTAAPSSSLNID